MFGKYMFGVLNTMNLRRATVKNAPIALGDNMTYRSHALWGRYPSKERQATSLERSSWQGPETRSARYQQGGINAGAFLREAHGTLPPSWEDRTSDTMVLLKRSRIETG
jgi:hypothetical protein